MALRPKIVKLAKMVGGLTGMDNRIDELSVAAASILKVRRAVCES